MYTVLLPPGGYPVAVKYIISSVNLRPLISLAVNITTPSKRHACDLGLHDCGDPGWLLGGVYPFEAHKERWN